MGCAPSRYENLVSKVVAPGEAGRGTKTATTGNRQEHPSSLSPSASSSKHDDVEEHIQAVDEMRDKWMTSIKNQAEDMTSGEVDLVLDGVEKLVDLFQTARGKGQQQFQAPVDIQSLELRKRTPLEQGFAKYSAFGQILLDMAGPAMEAMPFGAPAAAVIGAVYARAAQAARLSCNCEMLLQLLKSVDAQLARVLDSIVNGKKRPASSVEGALQQLLIQIIHGGRLMHEYAQRGFVLRFILSKGDERRFAELDQGIRKAMEWTSFCVSMDLMVSPASYQHDESAGLRSAVCAAAGMPEEEAKSALTQLSKRNPGQLQELVQQHGNFSVQVLAVELDSIAERMGALEVELHGVHGAVQVVDGRVQGGFQEVSSKLDLMLQQLSHAASRQEKHTQLPGYLKEWWSHALGRVVKSVPVDIFFSKLVQWFKDKGMLDQLLEYEEELERGCLSDHLMMVSKKMSVEEGGRALHFLGWVVLPLLDTNQDNVVDRAELLGLQVTAEEFARRLGETTPSALEDLLYVIFMGSSLDAVFKKAVYTASTPEIATVTQALKVQHILSSYGIHFLLESHVPGTRQWLFDRVNKWLEVALSAGKGAANQNQHRMFLLLAGPGMGKSVFSAVMEKKLEVHVQTGKKLVQVRHFFKVGESRAQGKAMVLCLAHQLAEQLPGMASLLRPVIEEHGSAEQLSMKDTFDKYLLEPLTELDNTQHAEHPVVIMLLDAIDEAADGAAGCEAVASLVGFQMAKLPAWVKIVLTGRPQMQSSFDAWVPEWLEPSARNNLEDMSRLLVARLQQGGYVSPVDMATAVEVMLQKSQGQFIWAKYAFDELCRKEGHWTPAEIGAALPFGLFGVFRHVMTVLEGALQEEQPATLDLLRRRLLPLLVAAKAPLSPQQLTVMAGAEQPQVELLLRLLVNLFPTRPQSGTWKVFPYHKSVLDWLAEDPLFGVDAGLGHACAGKACFDAVMAARVGSAGSDVGGSCHGKGESSQPSACILEYALRYGVTHLCHADGCLQHLEGLILDFGGFWTRAFAQGCGTQLLKDLIDLGPKTSTAVNDVVRWLRLASSYLMAYPRATWQLACDAPHNTVVARHANSSLPTQPHAKLLTKEEDWHACLSTLTGHKDSVMSIAVSGNTIVSGSGYMDRTVRVWDLQSGTCKATLEGHSDRVTSVALSPDARLCVSGSDDKTVRVWDLQSGTCKATLKGHSHCVTSVALSPDARLCVSGSGKTVRVWDLQSGTCKATLKGYSYYVTSVALSPDARLCVSGSWDRTVRVWDLQSGTCKATLEGHSHCVTSVALSPDARLCVSGSGELLGDNTVRVWDLQSGTCKATLEGHFHCVTSVALSPDARLCVSGSWDGTVRVWDLQSGTCKATLKGHSDYVTSVALSPDARLCVSGSKDKTVRVWDLQSGICKATLEGHSGEVLSVALSPDARLCVSGSWDRRVRVWDLQSGICKATLEGHSWTVTSVALSPDARLCVSGSGDSTVRVWDLQSGTCKAKLEGHSDRVNSVALSPDARLCVSGSIDKTVRVWDLQSGTCKATLVGHSRSVNSVALSPDARLCVSGSGDKTVRMWDLTAGSQLACANEGSEEGAELRMALADSWRAGVDAKAAVDGVVAWEGIEGRTIHWRNVKAGGLNEAESSTVFIMPPMRANRVFYSNSCHTVSFFEEASHRFICYALCD